MHAIRILAAAAPLALAAGCTHIDSASIDKGQNGNQPLFEARLVQGVFENISDVELEWEADTGEDTLEADVPMAQLATSSSGNERIYRFGPILPLPQGTRVDSTWTATYGLTGRTQTATRRTHIGHDARLVGLVLRQPASELPLPVSPLLAECRQLASGASFDMLVFVDNASFSTTPPLSLRGNLTPQGAVQANPSQITENAGALPSQADQTPVRLGPFTATIQGTTPQAADVSAELLTVADDFGQANNQITPNPSPATGNPACFDGAGQFQPELCQTCLVVVP
ncbi:hypothetical protein SH611_13440 [Geminicoccaceae bacterium 1502E]|nr:hypothetical protein [Geminicoccaceae bacterium 1502E]